MNSGDLLSIKKEELIYGYIFKDINRKRFIRVKLETGVYLIVNVFSDNFYEIFVDKKIVMVKLNNKEFNTPS